jgi:hypothetical protein
METDNSETTDNSEFNMETATDKVTVMEIPSVKKKYSCSFCGKNYKSNSGRFKHQKKCIQNPEIQKDDDKIEITQGAFNLDHEAEEYEEEVEEINEEDEYYQNEPDDERLYYLRSKLIDRAIKNPRAIDLSAPVHLELIERINMMTAEELEMRLIQMENSFAKKIDSGITKTLFQAVNLVVAQTGYIDYDILNKQVQNDEILQEVTTEYLSMKYLIDLPPQAKIGLLYSTQLANAYGLTVEEMRKNPQFKKEHMQKHQLGIMNTLQSLFMPKMPKMPKFDIPNMGNIIGNQEHKENPKKEEKEKKTTDTTDTKEQKKEEEISQLNF